MNFENILVIGICFVAIAIVTYYFYSKYTSQQNDMNALSKRFETIEMMFTMPSPQKELSDIYNRKYTNPSRGTGSGLPYQQMEPLVPSKISCEIGLCDLQPLQLETNGSCEKTQIDKIDDDELKSS
jgi:hypothetical protein